MLRYEKARIEDAEILSEIAKTAKQNWGYPSQWMQLWQDDLTLTTDYMSKNLVTKIHSGDELIGFYSIIDAELPEVDHLWLTPENQRKGYGSQIFSHIRKTVSDSGKSTFTLVAEPHAKGFYEKMNGILVSSFESKIPGRFLEVYEFHIFPKTD